MLVNIWIPYWGSFVSPRKIPKNTFTCYLFTWFGGHKCHSKVTLKTLKHMAAHS